jgi:cell filamentation protein, protein adenylyltransferase
VKPFVPHKLPIEGVDWPALVPLLGPANRALSTFNGVLYGLRNPDVLLSPLTTQEAVLSSRIEGTQATLGDVLKFEAGEAPKQESRTLDIQEIINYRKALLRSQDELRNRPFNLNLLLELHSILLDSVRGRDKARGRFRQTQNWIGPAGCAVERADFVPPGPLSLPPHLDAWEKYYHADQPDLLVQLAIVHAQFEIIHPFIDGNGRLGRMLIPLFLFEKGILSRPVFYLSAHLERNRDEYVSGLRGIGRRKEAWNDWIRFFLIAVTEQAQANTNVARRIISLYERLKIDVMVLTKSRFAIPVLDVLFGRPMLTPSAFENSPGMPSKPMLMSILEKLKRARILTVVREGSGRRGQILLFKELFDLCEKAPK